MEGGGDCGERKPLEACGQFCETEDYISMQIASDVLINNVFIAKQPFALSKWWCMQHFCRWFVGHAGVILLLLLSIYCLNYVFRRIYKSQMQNKQNTATDVYFNYVVWKCTLFNIFHDWWLIELPQKIKLSIKYYIIMSLQSCLHL